MSLIVKIIISIVVAAVATGLTTAFAGGGHAAPVLFVAFCGATIVTALLVSIPRPAAQSTVSQAKQQTAPRQKTGESPGNCRSLQRGA